MAIAKSLPRGPFACALLIALLGGAPPAWAADDPGVERLATCKDSWLDWQKSNPAELKRFVEHFRASFLHKNNDAFSVPKTSESILGFRLLQAYPESIGMAVGFSVVVDADFDKTRRSVERILGKPLGKCDVSDGMRTCEREIGPMRTVTLMAGDGKKDKTTLLGCYYFYEK